MCVVVVFDVIITRKLLMSVSGYVVDERLS